MVNSEASPSGTNRPSIVWFENVRNTDVSVVGGKNASLGEIISAALRAPVTSVLTSFIYEDLGDGQMRISATFRDTTNNHIEITEKI